MPETVTAPARLVLGLLAALPTQDRDSPSPLADLDQVDLRVGPNAKGRQAIWLVSSPSNWVEVISKTDVWFFLGRGEPLGKDRQPVTDQLWAQLTAGLPVAHRCPADECTILVDGPDEPCGSHYLELLRDQAGDFGRAAAGGAR